MTKEQAMMRLRTRSPSTFTAKSNEQKTINRAGRIHDGATGTSLKLLTINNVIINGGVDQPVEPKLLA